MSEPKYFTVNVQGSGEHVGTISANSNEELNEKLEKACDEHYDANCYIEPIDMNNLQYKAKDITVNVDNEYEELLEITPTWLF